MMSRISAPLLRRINLSVFINTAPALTKPDLPAMDPATQKTPCLQLTPANSEALATTGAQLLQSGGVIAIPTDTLYGLAADAQNNAAVTRLYEIKGRDFAKPIAICLSQISQVYSWAHVTVPPELLQDLLPGPVTLVFKRSAALNPRLNPETDLIGIRIPAYDFVRQLAAGHGGPIALTSANPSAAPSTVSVEEFKCLWPQLDCVFDGGSLSAKPEADADRTGSTVIDLSEEGSFKIIRPGTAYEASTQALKLKYGLNESIQV